MNTSILQEIVQAENKVLAHAYLMIKAARKNDAKAYFKLNEEKKELEKQATVKRKMLGRTK